MSTLPAYPYTTSSFPSHGLLPKIPLNLHKHLAKYPTHDGRKIRIAILDTGVDPAAKRLKDMPGIQPHKNTAEEEKQEHVQKFGYSQKVIECIDCTGDGDIQLFKIDEYMEKMKQQDRNTSSAKAATHSTSKVSEEKDTQTKIVRTQHSLTQTDMEQPSTTSRATTQIDKAATKATQWTLISGRTFNAVEEWTDVRIGAKRFFEMCPKVLVDRIKKDSRPHQLAATDQYISTALTDLKKFQDEYPKEQNYTRDQMRRHNDLKARIETLKQMSKDYVDSGPLIDVIAFKHNNVRRAIVIKSDCDVTDLRDLPSYAAYGTEHKYGVFDSQSLLTFAVNFPEDDILSLVTVSGSHGTHVAGITAAYDADDIIANGVAPGAEIISLKIGDNRIHSLETTSAFYRAMIEMVRLKIDIANISFGEAACIDNRGGVIDWMKKIVHEYGITVLSSAGNAGPALTTVGAPGGTTSGVISVGAYVSSGMMEAEYNLLEKVPETMYTWCSRGPSMDGAKGVNFYAPGAAITSVPPYCLQNSQLMNGTSMSSPSACGALAVIMSGLKQDDITFTPHSLRKAAEYSARNVNDPLEVGFLDIVAAYELLTNSRQYKDSDANIEVTVRSGADKGRGVYLREVEETTKMNVIPVDIAVSFKEEETERMWDFSMELELIASQPWVQVPKYVYMGAKGRNFEIKVDATAVPAGLSYAEVTALDTKSAMRKIFQIPITITKPQILMGPDIRYDNLRFAPGHIERRFIAVPSGASWAEIQIKSSENVNPVHFICHLTQIMPQMRHTDTERHYSAKITAEEPFVRRFKVFAGRTLEFCLAQFWSGLGVACVDVEVRFHGLGLDGTNKITVNGGQGLASFNINSTLRLEDYAPKIKIDRNSTSYRPTEFNVMALGSRDVLPDGAHIFQAVSKYSLKISEPSDVTYSFAVSGHMYDSSVSLSSVVYDGFQRVVYTGDVYPKKVKLEKGDYEIVVQLRHESVEVLEKLKTMMMTVVTNLTKPKELTLDIYEDYLELFSNKKAGIPKSRLPPGSKKVVCVDTNIEIPKSVGSGDILIGQIDLNQVDIEDGAYEFNLIVPEKPKIPKEDKEDPLLIDLQVEAAKKVANKKSRLAFIDKLLADFPDHLPLLVCKLDTLQEEQSFAELERTAKTIIAQIDVTALSSALGCPPDGPSDLHTKEIKNAAKLRSSQQDALVKCYKSLMASATAARTTKAASERESLLSEWRKWLKAADKDIAFLLAFAQFELDEGRYGSSLQYIRKALEECGRGSGTPEARQAYNIRDQCLRGCGWSKWLQHEQHSKWEREPYSRPLF